MRFVRHAAGRRDGDRKIHHGSSTGRKLGAPFIELDKKIERVSGIDIGEVITLHGQAGMRRIERQCIERIVANCDAS
jgi:XRE family transcriptional regulator, aerobic/anaerobic benzoate catabolism transcriptional regulator